MSSLGCAICFSRRLVRWRNGATTPRSVVSYLEVQALWIAVIFRPLGGERKRLGPDRQGRRVARELTHILDEFPRTSSASAGSIARWFVQRRAFALDRRLERCAVRGREYG